MRILLDTHVFLWWASEPELLSPRAFQSISDEANQVYVSAVTAWEISIKHAKGLLDLPEDPEQFVLSRIRPRGFEPLDIMINHALHAGHLERHHSDPFDRMLVSQAQLDGLALVTADPLMARYRVDVIW